MKFVRRAAPHISLIISAMMLTFLILDRFNDAMGFLRGNQFKLLLLLFVAASALTSMLLIIRDYRDSE